MRLAPFVACAWAAAAVVAAAPAARANPYEAFIDIDTEEDLFDLFASGQITEETFEALIDLYYRGVDLNEASRERIYSLPNLTYDDVDAILAYRAEQGFIRDPADLVGAGALTPEQLLSIAPFLVVRDPTAGRLAIRGFAHAQARFTIGDDLAPPIGLRARVLAGKDVTAGVAASLTRLRVGGAVYDPNRDALIVEEPGLTPQLAKAYVAYETDDVQAIAGTYRIGFGQRLTFSNASDYTPNGIYRDDQLYRADGLSRRCRQSTGELDASPCADDYEYVTADFGWSESLLGVAAGLRKLAVGDGWLQLYGWGSYQPRSIYQYELYDAAACDDPRDDTDPACAAPEVFVVDPDDRLAPAPELAYSTLPFMYGEALAGANATYFLSRRNYVGVTGYAARTTWLVDDGVDGGPDDDLRLDFQEWASRPGGGEFGAIGLSTSVGVGAYDVAAEVAHSFDGMDDGAGPARGGGGPAVVTRVTYTDPGRQEVEVSARFYDVDFANPYARPIAQPDELEGQRARDEAGGRVRYTGRFGAVGVRGGVDVWTNPAQDEAPVKAEVYARLDVDASKAIRWGAWLEVQDRDLGEGGRGQCFEQPFEVDEAGEPLDCNGTRVSSIGRLRWKLDKRTSVSTQVQHELLDDQRYPDGFRQDVQAWLVVMHRPTPDLRLRGRLRYLSEDVADAASLETSIWAYLEAAFRLRAKDRLRIRADLYQYLDDRDRTALREPSPEIWLWAQYEAKF